MKNIIRSAAIISALVALYAGSIVYQNSLYVLANAFVGLNGLMLSVLALGVMFSSKARTTYRTVFTTPRTWRVLFWCAGSVALACYNYTFSSLLFALCACATCTAWAVVMAHEDGDATQEVKA